MEASDFAAELAALRSQQEQATRAQAQAQARYEACEAEKERCLEELREAGFATVEAARDFLARESALIQEDLAAITEQLR